jgi:dienelactone hydrolase
VQGVPAPPLASAPPPSRWELLATTSAGEARSALEPAPLATSSGSAPAIRATSARVDAPARGSPASEVDIPATIVRAAPAVAPPAAAPARAAPAVPSVHGASPVRAARGPARGTRRVAVGVALAALAVLAGGAVTKLRARRGRAPDPACAANGCLRAYRLIGRYPRAVLQGMMQPGVTLENGYDVYAIRFATDGRESTGVATIPNASDVRAPPGGYHIVGDNHGTVGIGADCSPSRSTAGAGIAGLFGAHGMIGVAPDDPVVDATGLHSYLVARVEGAAALDALRAAAQLADALGVARSGRYAVVGLSQGGHATLSAAAMHRAYAPELQIRAFAASGPATAWERHWRLGAAMPGRHIPVHAMLFDAWSVYYHWPSAAPVFAPAYASVVGDTFATTCVQPPLDAFPGLPSDPHQLFAPEFLAEYTSGQFARYAFVHDAFAANAIGSYTQTAPLRIYQGTLDEYVPAAATGELVDALRAGGVSVDYQVVPGAHHGDLAFGYIAYPQLRTAESIAWIRTQLDTGP